MKYLYICISFFFISCFFAQAQVLNDLENDLLVVQHEVRAIRYSKENIYIHTDKDIYEPGEDLWFKAYILNANNLKLSTNTKVIFVEFLKEELDQEEIITKEKYIATNGFANGHLFLAQILEEGTYQLIIHTKNTIDSRSETIRAVKRIEIRESIIPKVLIDTEFSKDSYKRTDEVVMNLSVFSRSRIPLEKASITANLYTNGERIDRIRAKTDENGETILVFPVKKTKEADYIDISVTYKKETVYHIVDIPFKNPAKIQFGLFPEGGNLVENLPNTVAFKSVDHHGNPLNAKGILYEDGQQIQGFEATHYGMGKFSFTPRPSKTYTVKLVNSGIDSIFKLPIIKKTGIKLQVDKTDEEHVHFSITKTEDVTLEKVYIRAQSHGHVYWMAIANLTNDLVRFKLPLDKFPQGIAEVTIFNDRFRPLAERLVYANMDKKLNVTLAEMSKSSFEQKDKVDLKFTVTDQYGKPAVGNFSLSVHDHLYAKKDNDYAMMPHYYLFSELKGHVYDALYYFDEKNKDRAEHLDLVLLTQGWRSYKWHSDNLFRGSDGYPPFTTEIRGKAFQRAKNGTLKNGALAEINVILPKITQLLTADQGGNFKLSQELLKIGRGFQITFFPKKSDQYILEIQRPFEEIFKRTISKEIFFPISDRVIGTKRQSSYDPSFSFSETNYLEEVNLTGFKDRDKNKGSAAGYKAGVSDYICFEYGILNCKNHSSGPAPIPGETYRLNDGSFVTYTGEKKEDDSYRGFVIVKGLYPEKEFYSPLYDKAEDKVFPDNRRTLFWAPNLISNEQGEISVSFHTSDLQTTFLGQLEGTDGNGLLGAKMFQFEVD